MKIWIRFGDRSIADLGPIQKRALINLGEAGYSGRHAVLGDRKLLGSLASESFLSECGRAYFARIHEELTQLGRSVAGLDGVVADADCDAPMLELPGSEWRLPLDYFANEDLCDRAELICENHSDCEVYEEAAKVLARSEFPDVQIKLRLHGGGGSTTQTSVSSALAGSGPFFACIVDSDRESPHASLGDTAGNCKDAWEDGRDSQWLGRFYILKVRELENAIPATALKSWADASRQSRAAEVLLELPFGVRAFVCMKEGDRTCRFFELARGLASSDAGYFSEAHLASFKTRFPELRTQCDACQGSDCVKTPGLTKRMLTSFIEWVKSGNQLTLRHSYPDWCEDFSAAARLAVTIGASFRRRL